MSWWRICVERRELRESVTTKLSRRPWLRTPLILDLNVWPTCSGTQTTSNWKQTLKPKTGWCCNQGWRLRSRSELGKTRWSMCRGWCGGLLLASLQSSPSCFSRATSPCKLAWRCSSRGTPADLRRGNCGCAQLLASTLLEGGLSPDGTRL